MQEQGVRRDCAFKCHRRRGNGADCPVDTGQDKNSQARLHAEAMLQCDGPDRAPDEEARDVQDPDRCGNRQASGVQVRQVREDRKHDKVKVQKRNLQL